MKLTGYLALLLLPCLALACGAPGGSSTENVPAKASAPVTSPELSLSRLSDGQVAVALRAPSDRRPRMVDVRVRWSKGWSIASHTAGGATSASQKVLHVKLLSDTEARVLVFSSSNTQRLSDGVLAQLSLAGSGKGTIEIVPSPPMLAPADTEQGLRVGDPISL